MMTVTTSKEQTFECENIFAPTRSGECVIQLRSERPLSEIATDFENVQSFHVVDPIFGEYDYNGYTKLISIVLHKSEMVTIRLVQSFEESEI